jgi:hypothetical protein
VGLTYLNPRTLYVLPADLCRELGGFHLLSIPIELWHSFPICRWFAAHLGMSYRASGLWGEYRGDELLVDTSLAQRWFALVPSLDFYIASRVALRLAGRGRDGSAQRGYRAIAGYLHAVFIGAESGAAGPPWVVPQALHGTSVYVLVACPGPLDADWDPFTHGSMRVDSPTLDADVISTFAIRGQLRTRSRQRAVRAELGRDARARLAPRNDRAAPAREQWRAGLHDRGRLARVRSAASRRAPEPGDLRVSARAGTASCGRPPLAALLADGGWG